VDGIIKKKKKKKMGKRGGGGLRGLGPPPRTSKYRS